jgi:hypothetical protein
VQADASPSRDGDLLRSGHTGYWRVRTVYRRRAHSVAGLRGGDVLRRNGLHLTGSLYFDRSDEMAVVLYSALVGRAGLILIDRKDRHKAILTFRRECNRVLMGIL